MLDKMGDGGGGHWLVGMVGVSASVNLPLHHEVHKFSSGTGSPRWSWEKGRKKWWWWWLDKHCSAFSILPSVL